MGDQSSECTPVVFHLNSHRGTINLRHKVDVMLNVQKPLLLTSAPSLRNRFVLYGSRSQSFAGEATRKGKSAVPFSASKASFASLLDNLASLKVPHSWFLHFYVVSVASSIFWAYQILQRGYPVRVLCDYAGRRSSSPPMTADQIAVTWSLMAVQGLRRLVESLIFRKQTASTMFIAHWLLGLCFYLAMSVAVWIEGAGERANVNGLTPHRLSGLRLC